jgi:hypothetical protein
MMTGMKKPDKLPRDGNQLAKRIVDISTGEPAAPPKPAAEPKAGGAKKTPPARRKKPG